MRGTAKISRPRKALRRWRSHGEGKCQIGECACDKFVHTASGYCKTCGHRDKDHRA